MRYTLWLIGILMTFLRQVMGSIRNVTLGKRPTVMMWTVAMTLMVQTFIMLMTCNPLRILLKLETKVLGKTENGKLKQILPSAFVCVDIFLNPKTRRQLLANSKFSQNTCLSTWHKRTT